jgi:aminotransferase
MQTVTRQAARMGAIPFSGIRVIFEAAAKLEARGEKVVHLEIGRPDFDTPAHIKRAAAEALEKGQVHYTSNYGIAPLVAAIAEKLRRDNGLEYDPKGEICVTVGANEAVLMAMVGLLDPGDEVLIPDPNWLHYYYCVRLADAEPISVPLREADGFRLTAEALAERITPRTRMLCLSTPHNPTGSVIDREALLRIGELADRHDLLVISDEIYEKMVYGGARHVSFATLPDMRARTLTVNGFSKAYAMDGWRLGYVAAPKALMDVLIRVHQYTTVCATSFAQAGALAAYTGPQDCVREMVAEFDRRRKLIVSALQAMPGISCVDPGGAFYVFPSVASFGMSSHEFAQRLLAEAKVAAVPGSAFGEYGEGYLRMAYSASYDDIAAGMERMRRFVEGLAR